MDWLPQWLQPRRDRDQPRHLRLGRLGEMAARQYLQQAGLAFLTANYRSDRGEIDLVFRESDCIAFVEVKTRSQETWNRPAAAVDQERRRRMSRAALDYLRRAGHPKVRIRFDIVEVLVQGDQVIEIRHLPNTFPLAHPYRYG